MARLRRGFEVLREDAEQAHGTNEALDAQTRMRAENPHRTAPGQVRSGDKRALDEFASNHNLRRN